MPSSFYIFTPIQNPFFPHPHTTSSHPLTHSASSEVMQPLVQHAITPTPTPTPPETENLLSLMQENFTSEWLRVFLLSESPIHVQHILSPSLLAKSLLRQMTLTYVTPPQSPSLSLTSSPEITHSFRGHDLFIPVHTHNETTVGVGIVQATVFSNPSLGLEAHSNQSLNLNFRFAINTQTATLTRVTEVKEADMFAIEITSLTCSTQRRIYRGFFSRYTLRQLALSENKLTSHCLLPHLVVAIDESYRHDCVVCGKVRSGQRNCECKLSFATPHTDYSFVYNGFFSTMSFFSGCSSGVATKRGSGLCTSSKEILNFGGCIFSASRKVDSDLVLNLCSWSLWDFAQELPYDPRQSQGLTSATEGMSSGDIDSESGGRGSPQEQLSESMSNEEETLVGCKKAALQQVSDESRGSRSHRSIEVSGRGGQTTNSFQLRRMLMEEKRKARNRASARRNNMRKREEYLKLEADVDARRAKIEQLRATEVRLRRENMALRAHLKDTR